MVSLGKLLIYNDKVPFWVRCLLGATHHAMVSKLVPFQGLIGQTEGLKTLNPIALHSLTLASRNATDVR